MGNDTGEAIEVTGFGIFSHCGRLAGWLREIQCSIGNFIETVRSVEKLACIGRGNKASRQWRML
ncbi:uncharacterized protein BKA55DRAFT_214773 [Fusarium redolens]|uniref:Uncharacterized protein n=1 Tax=Fusarium redolens TaxID=48865 RepID=A0A9P9JTZ5_FUSRE|nr:uncharacterized protein BKA55DRAFT_214773 [Fusarium redolens]KAH7222500.1 hypothetical protein BKA55DRAFT_214773 [Fusarium redolens]